MCRGGGSLVVAVVLVLVAPLDTRFLQCKLFLATPLHLILTTQTFSRHSSVPVLATRNAASLRAMLIATRNANRYSYGYSLPKKLLATLLARKGCRYLQQYSGYYSQLAKLLVTPNGLRNATHYSRLYSLLPAGCSQRHSIPHISYPQRYSPPATRDPQRSLPLATLIEDYPNFW